MNSLDSERRELHRTLAGSGDRPEGGADRGGDLVGLLVDGAVQGAQLAAHAVELVHERQDDRDGALVGGVGTTRRLEQRTRRFDGRRAVARAGGAREEEADDLVADELVDDAIVVEDGGGAQPIEPVEEGTECGRAESLTDAG